MTADAGRRVPVARTRRLSRHLGTLLAGAGLVLLIWSGVVWKWGDPITALYTTWEQRQLEDEFAALVADTRSDRPTGAGSAPIERRRSVEQEAQALRSRAEHGSAIGRLRIPRLGLNIVMVEGTNSDDLKRGPGRDGRTYMPGEGRLVYVAGHRTTYSAPFARIDALRPGDKVTVTMPYGTFMYVVSRHRIVDDEDLSVLESGAGEELALQACHPRFFATQRYIVWARPVDSVSLGGRTYALPEAFARTSRSTAGATSASPSLARAETSL